MSYKLYYFDGRGRGEIIRLIFAAAGVSYENVRFGFDEWAGKYKALAPSGVAPFLEDPVSGKTLEQSFAIARLLAARFGFGSSDPFEDYKIERILFQLKDIQEAAVPAIFGPEDQRSEAKAAFLETKAPGLLATLVAFLAESESKFATGKCLTLADLAVIGMTDFVELLGVEVTQLLARYPAIGAHRSHVLESNKKLADYIASRKVSAF